MVSEYSRRKGFDHAFGIIDELAELGYPHHLRVVGRVHAWNAHVVVELRAAARHPERIELCGYVPDVVAAYQELDPNRPAASPVELFIEMARWRSVH